MPLIGRDPILPKEHADLLSVIRPFNIDVPMVEKRFFDKHDMEKSSSDETLERDLSDKVLERDLSDKSPGRVLSDEELFSDESKMESDIMPDLERNDKITAGIKRILVAGG